MFVLSLCRQLCPDKIPYKPDIRLGEGADGEVLSLVGDEDKVMKLGILYEQRGTNTFERSYQHIQDVLSFFQQKQFDAYTRVYEYGHLGFYTRKNVSFRNGTQRFGIYYYTMEKLEQISEDEAKVFHSILSHEDRGIEKNYSPDEVREMLRGMSSGLDFDVEKVTLFYENIRSAPVSHLDIHVRNIMKNRLGDFKLIDLDRIELEKE